MYMTDINTSLRSNKNKKENPKSAGVIVKKILSGIFAIILGLALFRMASWQLAVFKDTAACANLNSQYCPYPADENSPPYRTKTGKNLLMDPVKAFLNIIMSFFADGLIGLSKGMECCDGSTKMSGGDATNVKNSNTMKSPKSMTSNINLNIGGESWKPFDVTSIGWPYTESQTAFPFTFSYWLGSSQIKAWSIPRQLLQGFFMFLENFMNEKKLGKFEYITRFILTCSVMPIFALMLSFGWIATLFSTIWGGFLQHIFNGNFIAMGWGFFLTWALVIFNVIVQPIELLASFFMIPAGSQGVNWGSHNFKSMKNGGYREIILSASFLAFVGVVINAFMPLINDN